MSFTPHTYSTYSDYLSARDSFMARAENQGLLDGRMVFNGLATGLQADGTVIPYLDLLIGQ